MQLLFALCSALCFTILATDADNAYANSPPPNVPTYVYIDDAYADWYKVRLAVDLDRSTVLPVLHALQGHPKSGALWEKHIASIMSSLGLVSTMHERNIYHGVIDGQRVLVCRQVDDLVVACADPALAKRLISTIGTKVDLSGHDLLNKLNGVNVDQTRNYVKVHCRSYIDRLLTSHPTAFPHTLIEPLSPTTLKQLDDDIGPDEHSTAAITLEKEMGFSYQSVLGEIIYAYTVCRLDIGYAVTKLARYSASPSPIH